jgi:hypothetical protein
LWLLILVGLNEGSLLTLVSDISILVDNGPWSNVDLLIGPQLLNASSVHGISKLVVGGLLFVQRKLTQLLKFVFYFVESWALTQFRIACLLQHCFSDSHTELFVLFVLRMTVPIEDKHLFKLTEEQQIIFNTLLLIDGVA